MATNVTFVFVAATVITIFAAGSILMGLISASTKPISSDISNAAASYSSTFLGATILFVFLAIIVMIFLGSKRSPF